MIQSTVSMRSEERAELADLGRRTLIMGVLNVTPDSFSDGGRFFDTDKALQHAREMIASGADIIDIGAESTRPGHAPVGEDEEWRRLAPVLRCLRTEFACPLSIDTYKPGVARRALDLGADIINDVWGGVRDPAMWETIAGSRALYILMHNSTERKDWPKQGAVAQRVRDELLDLAQRAVAVGVPPDAIILDPGVGFGKTQRQNLELINRMDVYEGTGYATLIGTSRKSVIGHALDTPVTDRLEGTAATVAVGIVRGVDIVRVHDVAEMARVCRMTDALVRQSAEA